MKFLYAIPVMLAAIALHADPVELPRGYVSVQTGFNMEHPFKDESMTLSSSLGSAHSILGGFRLYKGLTAEAEVSYLHNKFDGCSMLGYTFGVDGHIHKTKLATNLIYEYGFSEGTSVYAGLGGAQMWEKRSLKFLPVRMDGASINLGAYSGKTSEWSPQLVAGWNFSNSDNYQMGVRITHMRCKNNMDNSSIAFSVKRKLGT